MGCTSSKDVLIETSTAPSQTKASPSRDLTNDKTVSAEQITKDAESDVNNCPICLNPYKEPKTLPCQHVICSRCLQRYINSLENTAKLRGFPCPICRKLTIIDNPDTPRQTWVSQLESEGNRPSVNGNALINLAHSGENTRVIKSRIKTDNFDPSVYDIVVVTTSDSEVVVVADFNNKSLKSFSTSKGQEKHTSLVLESNPFCMTLISDTKIALTLPWSDKIVIVEVAPNLRIVNSIDTDKAYYGIAGIDEDCMAASTTWQTPPSVDIIDHTGRIIKSIDTDDYGDTLFSDPWYLAITPSGDILVSDCQEQSLRCLDQSGLTRWRYKPRDVRMLKTPAGVTCDSEGNIYLVDTDSNHVIKLDEYGRYICVVASRIDGLERPRCVTITSSGVMYVTLECGDIRVLPLLMQV